MKFIAILLIAFATFAVAIPLEMEQVSSSEQMEVSADESSVSSAEESPLEETSETEAVDVESSAESEEEPAEPEFSEEEPVEGKEEVYNFAKSIREKMNFCIRPINKSNWKPYCASKNRCVNDPKCQECKDRNCALIDKFGTENGLRTLKYSVLETYQKCQVDENYCDPFQAKQQQTGTRNKSGSWWHSIMGADTDADEAEFDEQAEPEIEDMQLSEDEESMPFASNNVESEEDSIESSEEEPVEDLDSRGKFYSFHVRKFMSTCLKPRSNFDWRPSECYNKTTCQTNHCKRYCRKTCKVFKGASNSKGQQILKENINHLYSTCSAVPYSKRKGNTKKCAPLPKNPWSRSGSWWHSIMDDNTDADEPEFDEQAEPEIEDIQYTDDEESMPFAESEL